MEIILAGYNLDADVIAELSKNSEPREDITPETLSAAYARISRDPRPINELRQDARKEVEKARKSNAAIIFGLGHSSVAEHASFNFDIINVTRYAMEELEKFRLCSYTEKSQRYITLEKDFLIPTEIKGTEFETRFLALINQQSNLYNELFLKLKEYVNESNPELATDPKQKRLLEGWAKEDARYVTSLATYSQAGMTLNARNLEKLLRRFSVHPLAEIREIGQKLHSLVKDITPSIVKYPEGNEFERDTYPNIAAKVAEYSLAGEQSNKQCQLISVTENADDKILATLLFKASNIDYQDCLQKISKMSQTDKEDLFRTSVKHMKLYDQLIREFEMTELTYELTVSAACFGQLKRHRMASLITQNYNPQLDIIVPPAITAIGMAEEFSKVVAESTALYYDVKKINPIASEYMLTNAHQRKVLFKTNIRELYHISRLREDAHAQWDIRNISSLMVKEAKKVMPICTAAIGGKDKYVEIYQKLFKETVAQA